MRDVASVFTLLFWPWGLSLLFLGVIVFCAMAFRARWRNSKFFLGLFWFNLGLFIALILVHELELFYFDDQVFTSSGDFTIRLSATSLAIGYALLAMLLVYAMLVARGRVKRPRWHLPLLLLLALYVEWNNTHSLVCGTNGMRWYDYHFSHWEYFGGHELIGSTDESWKTEGPGNPFKHGNYISSIEVNGSELILHRQLSGSYHFRHSFLLWQFDEEDLKPMLTWR